MCVALRVPGGQRGGVRAPVRVEAAGKPPVRTWDFTFGGILPAVHPPKDNPRPAGLEFAAVPSPRRVAHLAEKLPQGGGLSTHERANWQRIDLPAPRPGVENQRTRVRSAVRLQGLDRRPPANQGASKRPIETCPVGPLRGWAMPDSAGCPSLKSKRRLP